MAASNVYSAEQIADILMASVNSDNDEQLPSTDESSAESSDSENPLDANSGDEISDSHYGNPMVSSGSNSSSDGEMVTTPCVPTRGRARVCGGVRRGRGQHSITPTRGRVRTRGGTTHGSLASRGGRVLTGGDPRPLLEALANGGFDAGNGDNALVPEDDAQHTYHAQEPQTSNPPDTEPTKRQHTWSDIANDPPVFLFDEQSGLLVETHDESPGACFDLFLTDDLLNLMVAETNRYADIEINKQRPLRRKSRFHDWKETHPEEMKHFIALLLHMGPVNLPTVEHYWSNNALYKSVFFKGVTGRNRFQLLLRFWHFADNREPSDDRLYKIRPMLDSFNQGMDRIYYPLRELSIDESMVLWRGRLMFRQYIKNKRHKYGIKIYELCESRGLVLRIRIYSGTSVEDPHCLGQSTATVLDLLRGFLDKGHAVFTDNYYNSVELFKLLSTRSTYICGTLRSDRKGNPKEVVNKKLKKGENIWRESEGVVVCKWKDKRDVLTISNMHSVEMVAVRNRNGKEIQKPNIVRDYNSGMSGVDRSDQMLSYYSALRKTLRWYKKIGLHILEVAVINAHILYNDKHLKKMGLLEFREAVVMHLIGDRLAQELKIRAKRGGIEDPTDFHYLEAIHPSEKKQRPTKPCRICSQNKQRHESRYFCPVCTEKPALCVDKCFRQYHTNKTD